MRALLAFVCLAVANVHGAILSGSGTRGDPKFCNDYQGYYVLQSVCDVIDNRPVSDPLARQKFTTTCAYLWDPYDDSTWAQTHVEFEQANQCVNNTICRKLDSVFVVDVECVSASATPPPPLVANARKRTYEFMMEPSAGAAAGGMFCSPLYGFANTPGFITRSLVTYVSKAIKAAVWVDDSRVFVDGKKQCDDTYVHTQECNASANSKQLQVCAIDVGSDVDITGQVSLWQAVS